jgi:hypothetical protein
VSVVESHVSVVQAMPSSQGALLTVCSQPVPGTQLSIVQSLPSSQRESFGVWVQPVSVHASAVHAMPSSQRASSGVWTQPVGVHVSVVQPTPSSHWASLVQGGPPDDEAVLLEEEATVELATVELATVELATVELAVEEDAVEDEDAVDEDAVAGGAPPWPGGGGGRSLRAPQAARKSVGTARVSKRTPRPSSPARVCFSIRPRPRRSPFRV